MPKPIGGGEQRSVQLNRSIGGCLHRVDPDNTFHHRCKSSPGTHYAMTSHESPKLRRLGSIINQLMSRRGYASSSATDELSERILAAVDQTLQASIQVGNVRQGVLQIYATDSVTLQELNFQKRVILQRIQTDMPHCKITDLRFRISSP